MKYLRTNYREFFSLTLEEWVAVVAVALTLLLALLPE